LEELRKFVFDSTPLFLKENIEKKIIEFLIFFEDKTKQRMEERVSECGWVWRGGVSEFEYDCKMLESTKIKNVDFICGFHCNHIKPPN
jgi:hypothetical protein